ncbi:hypothetical protein KIPB_011524 [Kipferlia bialata]|uniref:Uncharacterized protein n=1 Tax=Kipferlia bialata TaxID=797122 RepID=A0A9K3D7N9_9EUKA|nr:hypothetical protein KIPB_011524 [Kipferlia bialata]|eukprot:g11524.t1
MQFTQPTQVNGPRTQQVMIPENPGMNTIHYTPAPQMPHMQQVFGTHGQQVMVAAPQTPVFGGEYGMLSRPGTACVGGAGPVNNYPTLIRRDTGEVVALSPMGQEGVNQYPF